MIFDRARAKPGALGALRLWIFGFGAALAAALAGCSTNTKVSNGTPVVTVSSQAAGDFSTYIVGVTLYSLTRSDGYIAYPAGYTYEEFADLTQRVDLTELLNAVGIPTGTYKSVSIGIDYSFPTVYLKGQSTAATVQNSAGTANPGIVYVNVKLDPSHPLVINLNQSTRFALDFDLAASNSISGNTVTIRPFVIATTTPTDTGPIRARGLFVAADTGAGNFVENIRPFEDNVYSTVGALTVNPTSTTYYNVNGKVYTGSAGLAAVAALTSNTPIVAYGTLGDMSTITPALTATQVYAGTVVSNGQYEHVRGIVTARSGNNLTVTDATFLNFQGNCPSNLCFSHYQTATVSVGSSTLMAQDGTAGVTPTTQSISVGSQIDAVGFGSTNSSGALTLDATQGFVRLQSTPAWGTLTSGAAGSATLNLLAMGPVAASGFNFAGTGTSSANDAVASAYAVDTAGAGAQADQSATPAGTLLRVDGIPAPFGAAPPDFAATAVTPASSEPANLVVEWSGGKGTTSPFTSYDATSLALNLANATTAEVVVGPQPTQLTGTPAITISGGKQFAIGNVANGISVFSAAGNFASDLTSTLNGSNSVFRVVAVGSYDAATNTFTASRIDVALE
ncbi:MAG TPA: hypothetical protein VHE11_09525 [Steroidobacteraceae bacterium]|nr:hypothetical protein [Steroidobacteraceae bacterium]